LCRHCYTTARKEVGTEEEAQSERIPDTAGGIGAGKQIKIQGKKGYTFRLEQTILP
jgi:hypothetical protein